MKHLEKSGSIRLSSVDASDRFLDISTNGKNTSLADDTTPANHLSAACFVMGSVLIYWKGITTEHTFIMWVFR